MLGQMLHDQIVIGQLVRLAHAVDQHHLFIALISLRIADDAHEGREAGAGGQQVKPLAGQQVVGDQRAGWLAADDDGVTHLHVLQPRRQRAVGHLDAEKFQMLFVVGADDAVGAQQRLVVHPKADHREVAILEPERRVTGRGEGEQLVGPVMDGQHTFFVESAHGISMKVEKVRGAQDDAANGALAPFLPFGALQR